MNTQSLNLKELEKLAYRRTFEDGLLEIYIGGILASFAAFGLNLFPGIGLSTFTVFGIYLAGIGLVSLIFWLGKRYITLPRIGQVKFGPARQKRLRDLALALAAIVAVQVVFVILQFVVLASPALRSQPLLAGISQTGSLPVAIVAALFVTPGMLMIAWMTDNPRGYYHAVVFALAIFLMILLDHALWMVLGGMLVLIPGVIQLAWFVRQYPLEGSPDDQSRN